MKNLIMFILLLIIINVNNAHSNLKSNRSYNYLVQTDSGVYQGRASANGDCTAPSVYICKYAVSGGLGSFPILQNYSLDDITTYLRDGLIYKEVGVMNKIYED